MAGLINWKVDYPMYQGWILLRFKDTKNRYRYWARKDYDMIPNGYISTYIYLDRLLKKIDEVQG